MNQMQFQGDIPPEKTLLKTYMGWVLRRPLPVLAVIALVTVLFAWDIPRLRLETSVYTVNRCQLFPFVYCLQNVKFINSIK